jgi:hypothetical protein
MRTSHISDQMASLTKPALVLVLMARRLGMADQVRGNAQP